jgi:biotin carboxylase
MSRETILILGAGRHQAPLIQLAETAGYATVIADNHPNSPGRAFCSFPSFVSATDLEGCRNLATQHRVSAILTTGTDQPVRVMATLSHELGLPCYISPEGALLATNKLAQRQAMLKAGVPQPRYIEVSDSFQEARDWNHFPCVVKPCDSQGQRGVKRVDSSANLIATMQASARLGASGRVILEEFIEGPEVTASVWMDQGAIRFIAISDRVTYSLHSLGVCFQHIFPSLAASPWESEIHEMAKRIATTFGMRCGPIYIQILITPVGPRLVEAAARIGGGHEANLLPYVSNFNPLAALVDTIRPKPFTSSPTLNPDAFASVNFLFAHAGEVASLDAPPPTDQPGILEAGFYVRPGDRTRGMLDGQGRVGYFLALGANRADTESHARSFYSSLKAIDPSGHNLLFTPEPANLSRPESPQ